MASAAQFAAARRSGSASSPAPPIECTRYLGGLGNGGDLSPRLASRQEVGAILRASGVPTIELRASIVIGSGSASFEAVRVLVNMLPANPAPRSVEIGGDDRVTYVEVVREYARRRRLRRRVVPLSTYGPPSEDGARQRLHTAFEAR